MKKKDVFLLIISIVGIVACSLFIYRMLYPAKTTDNQNTDLAKTENFKYVSESIDDVTIQQLDALKNYNNTDLNNLGKPDLFAGF